MELVADEDEDNYEQGTSTEWVILVDRGGLWHVTNETFRFFCAIEAVLCTHLTVSAIKKLIWFKRCHRESHLGNDDVAFFWFLTCIEAEEEGKKELLSSIIDLWVTI